MAPSYDWVKWALLGYFAHCGKSEIRAKFPSTLMPSLDSENAPPPPQTEYRASEYLCREVKYGIYEKPTVPFWECFFIPKVPHTKEDLEFMQLDLKAGFETGIYERITPLEADMQHR
jgi:hypothetical protein